MQNLHECDSRNHVIVAMIVFLRVSGARVRGHSVTQARRVSSSVYNRTVARAMRNALLAVCALLPVLAESTGCAAGKYKVDSASAGGGTCLNCDTGTYKTLAGDSLCLGCPANSVSAPGSTSRTQCICKGGYNGPDGGPCSACLPTAELTCGGTCPCSPMNGTSGTIQERSGDYLNGENCWWRITSSSVITWSFTMFLTDFCCDKVFIETCRTSTCNTGVVLLLSTLRGHIGSVRTLINSVWTYPTYDSVWTNQPGSGRNTIQLRFTSDRYVGKAGFSGEWSVPPPPPLGACSSPLSCVANSYYSFAGTVGCQTCPSNSASPTGSMAIGACVCNAGFGGANGALCTQCGAGTYKSGDVCVSCPLYSNSEAQSTSCVCNAGFIAGNAGQCACAANKYFSDSLVRCENCPVSSTSPSYSTDASACVCNAGFGGANGALCTQCGAGTYELGDVCVSCPLYSNSEAQSTSCVCNAGFIAGNAGQCACAANKYFSDSLVQCENCPASSTSPSDSTAVSACVCNAGYIGTNGATCSICDGGTYKVGSDPGNCDACPSFSTSTAGSTACQCNAGYTGADGGPCSACAVGKSKITTGSAACTDCIPGKYYVEGH